MFELWLETSLLPTLEPGQVLVQGDRIFQLIQVQAVNCCTYPLIPQTSTCIEQCWSWLKSRIRKQLDRFNCLLSGDRRCIALFVRRHLDGGYTIEGHCNRTIFKMWLETSWVPTLIKGQVIVMDNATFHKGGEIKELIPKAGCRLLNLPPYSRELNRIEQRRVLVGESNS